MAMFLLHFTRAVKNGVMCAISIIDINGTNESPFAPMHSDVFQGAIDANDVIDAIGFHL